jgi:TPR repeat protein
LKRLFAAPLTITGSTLEFARILKRGTVVIRLILIAVFAICAALPAPLVAQNFDVGLDAAIAGDYATALENWRPLAEGGDAYAQYNLGTMYYNGNGVPQDDAEAVRLYRLSVEQGNANAQYSLGFMYSNGQGVLQDDAEAAKLYRMSAKQGYDRAQYTLGVMYANGQGVLQSHVLAHLWYNIASANGNELGSYNRDIIVGRMTREQIAEAQALARVCMSSGYQNCD